MRFLFLALLLLPLLMRTSSLHAATLYKWVDDKGEVRYSDQLPPGQAGKGFERLTTEGFVVEKKAPELSPEEKRRARIEARRRAREERRRAEEEARRRAEQEHHDTVLMMTFSNEDEIREAKDERVEVVQAVIRLLKRNIADEQRKLESLEQEAREKYTDKGEPVPGGLAQKIEYSSGKILSKQTQLLLKYDELERINSQFVKDLTRYRELKKQEAEEQRRREELRRKAEELGLDIE
jgi:chromosome segregation ATPase